MVNLKLQKRLAASVLGCGLRKVWMDPNQIKTLKEAGTRKQIRSLVAKKVIVAKPYLVHSRYNANLRREAKAKGRHRGFGKRRGTREARFPSKSMWVIRQRCLRRFLAKSRAMGKIDKTLYRQFYNKCKGNVYKNRRVLEEAIFQAKAEQERAKALSAQAQLRREKLIAKKAKLAAKLALQ